MEKPDYDDLAVEQRWCEEQRARVTAYLRAEGVNHGRIGEWPAWHVAPIVSIWAIESPARPPRVGWWVIAGDCPTDYLSSADVEPPQHPRNALRAFAENWQKIVEAWREGREPEEGKTGGREQTAVLAPLLSSRAGIIRQWADDDALWEAMPT